MSILVWAGLAWADSVVFVPLDGWMPAPVEELRPPVAWTLDRREIEVFPGEETRLVARWTLRAVEPGWIDLPLLPAGVPLASATVNGAPVALEPGPDGFQHLALRLDGSATVAVVAALPTPSSGLDLPLAPAMRQRLVVRGADWDADLPGAVRIPGREPTFAGGPPELALSWRPVGPPPERPPLVRAEVSAATTLDAGGLVAVARLRYRVVRGAFETLSFALPPVEGLEVVGDGLLAFERAGDRIEVRFSRPVEDHAELELRYRAPSIGAAGAPLPVPWPVADEAGGWLTVLRADESLIAPSPVSGAAPAAASDLPAWAGGLSEGAPVARYRLSGGAPQVLARVIDWDPIDAPPTLVDEARYEVAFAEHGRLLLRARYQVRNDRNQFLRLDVPDGLQLIAATVAGRQVQAAIDEDGRLLIPLEKSVETLEGLVSFPVDISFWGAEAAWDAAGLRELRTPSVDAPVAYARWELVLPPGLVARDVESRATTVGDWSGADRLEYGRASGQGLKEDEDDQLLVGGAPFEEDTRRDQSQYAWNQAYDAYKNNRFDESAQLLEQSLALDPSNRAAQQLQSNLDVLVGDAGGKADTAEARRVRELARAKTMDAEIEQEKLQEEADAAVRAGDYAAAQEKLEALNAVSGMLAAVEQAEASDKKVAAARSSQQYSEVVTAAENKRKSSLNVSRPAKGSGSGARYAMPVQSAPPATTPIVEAPASPTPDEVTVTRGPVGGLDRDYDGVIDAPDAIDELPLYEGYATVIDHDPMLSWAMQSGLVVEPDLYALLTAEDLVWTGEEGLHTEVSQVGLSGLGSSGYGYGGAGDGMAVISRDFLQVNAVVPGVRIPRAGTVLRLEARLLQEGEPMTAQIRYSTPRAERRKHR